MVYLDTNALIRFFTKDDPVKAQKVRTLLESKTALSIPAVVFPEIEYVLSGVYNAKRKEVITLFTFLASRPNIRLTKIIHRAILIYIKTNLDMADCLITAESLKGQLASFDKQLLGVDGVKSYW
jgi:predicted nucleic-acid-binding protein